MLNVIDEFTHECLGIQVARKLKAIDLSDVPSALFILRGVPSQIRSDNGPEFVAKAVQEWITAAGAKTAYITPASRQAVRTSLPRGSLTSISRSLATACSGFKRTPLGIS